MHVNGGDAIGKVCDWKDHPNDTHLHFGMAAKGADGNFHGVDPSGALKATDGSAQGRDIVATPGGGYAIGSEHVAPVPGLKPEAPPPSQWDGVWKSEDPQRPSSRNELP